MKRDIGTVSEARRGFFTTINSLSSLIISTATSLNDVVGSGGEYAAKMRKQAKLDCEEALMDLEDGALAKRKARKNVLEELGISKQEARALLTQESVLTELYKEGKL